MSASRSQLRPLPNNTTAHLWEVSGGDSELADRDQGRPRREEGSDDHQCRSRHEQAAFEWQLEVASSRPAARKLPYLAAELVVDNLGLLDVSECLICLHGPTSLADQIGNLNGGLFVRSRGLQDLFCSSIEPVDIGPNDLSGPPGLVTQSLHDLPH